MAPHGLCLFAGLTFGWLLIRTTELHFPEDTFALHLLLQGLERLIDVIVPDYYVNDDTNSLSAPMATIQHGFGCCPDDSSWARGL